MVTPYVGQAVTLKCLYFNSSESNPAWKDGKILDKPTIRVSIESFIPFSLLANSLV